MASRWYAKVSQEELGPFGFQDLAKMLRSGRIAQDTLVRREIGGDWTRARDVIGLLRAAAIEPKVCEEPPEEKLQPVAVAGPVREAGKTLPRFRRKRIHGRWLLAIALVGMFGGMAVVGWRSLGRPHGHKPLVLKLPSDDPSKLQEIQAMRPVAAPSAPTRPVGTPPGSTPPGGTPQLVPGLEDMEPAFTPSLTADLRIIVFSSRTNSTTDYDLYEAARDSPSRPFGKPRLIKTCAYRAPDAWPTLSADGLELIFRRATRPAGLWRATRATPSSEFGEPKQLTFPENQLLGREVGTPQLLDANHLLFVATLRQPVFRSFLLAKRSSALDRFDIFSRIRFYNQFPAYFLTADRLRTYAGGSNGLFVSARKNQDQEFDEGTLLAPATVTGPVEDQIWVSPREELIFYCSPGPGEKLGSRRKLWMIRVFPASP